MISLDEMKNNIVETLKRYSANELPQICSSIGLKDGTIDEAFKSKRLYVKTRINTLKKDEIINVLYKIKENLDENLIPEEKYSYCISDITKEEITNLLINGCEISDVFGNKKISFSWHGRLTELDFIERIWDFSNTSNNLMCFVFILNMKSHTDKS